MLRKERGGGGRGKRGEMGDGRLGGYTFKKASLTTSCVIRPFRHKFSTKSLFDPPEHLHAIAIFEISLTGCCSAALNNPKPKSCAGRGTRARRRRETELRMRRRFLGDANLFVVTVCEGI